MLSTYTYPRFPYVRPAELDGGGRVHWPVIVVGAGPVGLTAAIDLAQQGLEVLVLDDDDTVSIGSRGLCYAKRTLEILDRLGCGDAVVDKGVGWNVGRTYLREREVYHFDLKPEPDHERPGMINLQQYYLEEYLLERAAALGVVPRWKHKVIDVQSPAGGAHLRVQTVDGTYGLACDWLVVADGARSTVRHLLGLDMEGRVFQDRFLIADVHMKAAFPAERRFWFDPPFHPNQSVLLHREADDVWRIDFQLGWNADPEEEKRPEKVVPRIAAMLGPDVPFELEWVSVYTFQCRRMARFRHGHLLFVGDAAHQVSPFGARGANSGIQDTDNLAWKLALVMRGAAPERLLDSYSDERVTAADENLLNSTRSTDFITPKSPASRLLRDTVLELAQDLPFARRLVNSGRLSVPCILAESALNTADDATFGGPLLPGATMEDAPVQGGWLLRHLGGRFQLLLFCEDPSALSLPVRAAVAALARDAIAVQTLVVAAQAGALDQVPVLVDHTGAVARRCDARPGTALLLRPDQHLAARWRALDADAVRRAVAVATCNAAPPMPCH